MHGGCLGLGTVLAREYVVTKRSRHVHHLSTKKTQATTTSIQATGASVFMSTAHRLQYSTITQVSQTMPTVRAAGAAFSSG